MTADIYEQLAASLDRLPAGFPRTPGGVEMRILRRLFTPEEAAIAVHLTVIAEEPRVIAARAGIDVEEASRRLDAMERKRLIYSSVGGGRIRYMAAQFVVGIWEGQVDRLTPELVRDFEEYLPVLFDAAVWRKAPQMRVVPVNSAIDARTEVLPYEVVAELVRGGHGDYAVANCICRQEMKLAGHGCDRPMESCLALGSAAHAATRSGRGWSISRDEALEILRHADAAGLVLQASNSKDAVFICTCCGCCCGVLRSIKRHPNPSRLVAASFVAALETDSCEGCGVCATRCQMDALAVVDGTATLDETRCIGCGLCVDTCPTSSLSLRRKPASEQPAIPETIVQNYLQVGRARGRFGLGELASLQIRSIVDRWRV